MTTANLTIQDNSTVDQYESTGESQFAFTFPITAAEELSVSKNQVPLVYGVDWSLNPGSLNEAGGGSITLAAGSTPGDIITLWLDMPIERLSGYSAGAATLLPEDLNADAAHAMRISQMLRRDLRRALRLPVDDPLPGQGMQLPIALERLGTLLGFSPIDGRMELYTLAEVGGSTVPLTQSLIGSILWPTTKAEQDAGVEPKNKAWQPGYIPRYAAAGAEVFDGSTDGTQALLDAIAQQQQGGEPVRGIPGTLLLANWVKPTLTAPLVIDGNRMVVKCGTSPAVSFVALEANFDISGCMFDGWYRVIDNRVGTGGAITEGRFWRNTVLNSTAAGNNNAYPIIISNPVKNLWIERNLFKDALTTGIFIGENTYADQDDWENISICNNVLDGVTCPAGPASGFGILVYGKNVLIQGNTVTGVEGATGSYSSSNGAFGIYTKARYTRVLGNRVHAVGLSTNADVDQLIGINIKGSDRSDTSTPQGFAVICLGNVITNVGVANTSGTGISSDHSDVLIAQNWMEGIGRRGIFVFGPTGMTGTYQVLGNRIILAAGANENGVEVVPASTPTIIAHNIITAGRAPVAVRTVNENASSILVKGNILIGGTGVRLTAENHNIAGVTVANNVLVSGTHGLFLQSSGGGALSNLQILGNDLGVASTAAIGGTLPASARVRDNRGYKDENSGVTSAISTGTAVSHGCAATPAVVHVTPLGSGPTDCYISAVGATTFTINFGGGGSQAFSWTAKTANNYA